MLDNNRLTLASLSEAQERVQAIIDSGEARKYVARDRVDESRVNVLCDVLGDNNPIYRSESAAKSAGHPGIVAPPAALQVWTMNLLGEDPGVSPVDKAYQCLREAGLNSVVAVNSEQHYDRYVLAGEKLTSTEIVESLSEPKQTGLGVGMFITTLLTFTSETDEQVGTMRFRTLWYAPGISLDDVKGN